MKRGFIIGIVWTALMTCLIAFGATVFFLENNSSENSIENFEGAMVENSKTQEVYQTNQSSIRTNNLANLDDKEKNEEKKNEKSEKIEKISEEIIDLEDSLDIVSNKVSTFIRPINNEILKPLSIKELVYSKTLNEWNVHFGTDYKAKLGDEVYAIRDGKIKDINFSYEYGDYIIIEHDDNCESLCANITVLDALKIGDKVEQGQLIGYVAESFGFEVADETHLHFELKKDDKYISI